MNFWIVGGEDDSNERGRGEKVELSEVSKEKVL